VHCQKAKAIKLRILLYNVNRALENTLLGITLCWQGERQDDLMGLFHRFLWCYQCSTWPFLINHICCHM